MSYPTVSGKGILKSLNPYPLYELAVGKYLGNGELNFSLQWAGLSFQIDERNHAT
jgi:hypothetical protein